jgi:hypothetical protein
MKGLLVDMSWLRQLVLRNGRDSSGKPAHQNIGQGVRMAGTAFVICDKQRGHDAAAIYILLAYKIGDGKVSDEPIYAVSVIFGESVLGPTQLCADCATLHRIPATGLVLKGDGALERYLEIDCCPACRFCVKETFPQSMD